MESTTLSFISRSRGVTLIELLVALAVLAGLLAFGVPAMADLVRSTTLRSITSEFVSSVQLTRSEAVKRNGRVVMCKARGAACIDGGGWEQGWIVFHDVNGNIALDPGEEVIMRREALPPSMRVTGNTPVSRYISYTSEGASKLVTGGFQAGTVTVCQRSERPTSSRQIVINAVGRPRVQAQTASSC